MSALTMNPAPPHRKPLPTYAQGVPSYANVPAPPQHYVRQPREPVHMRTPSGNSVSHLPTQAARNASPAAYAMPLQAPQPQEPARRTLSNATSSTSSTSTTNNAGLQRAPTTSGSNAATAPRRSTSSRSNSSVSPTSYVALMRKQKATVWCDRAQHEDPRILAAQRAAKRRAQLEVVGGHHHTSPGGRTSTGSSGMVGGVRNKIKYHGAPKASTYNSANMSGAGVPMRLSASEVDEGDSDDESAARYHSRTGSARSSLGSGHRMTNSYLNSPRGHSNGSTPPMGQSPVESMGDLLEEETPVPHRHDEHGSGYFGVAGGNGGSGSSGEREEKFGGVSGLPQPRGRPEVERKASEELRRRGSVDDRTMTMSGVRLFVANPDLSD